MNIENGQLFIRLNRLPEENLLSLAELSSKCELLEQSGNFSEAIDYAKLATNRYGLDGLLLYLPIRFRQIQLFYDEGEIIEQDVQEALAFIFFAREEANKQNKVTVVFDDLDKLEENLLSMIKDADFIVHEAKEVAKVFRNIFENRIY